MPKKMGELFATAYLLLIFGIYPFYMKEGYMDIGDAKYRFFIYCSLAGAGILTVVGIACGFQAIHRRWKRKDPDLIKWERLSETDLFVMLYATSVFLSYVLSDNRKEALWGTEGWNVGLVLWLVLCALYFLISRLWDGKRLIRYVTMIGSFVVFLLCILDRFSFYLIPLEVRDPTFISTLGNINWVCGYFSVLAPVGICEFFFAGEEHEDGKSRGGLKRIMSGIYTVIAFMAGFCQGGDSIFLFYGALFYILLWIAVKKRSRLSAWCALVFLWGVSAQAVRVLRILLPDRYNYDTDNLCAFMTDSNGTLLAAAVFLIAYFFLKWRERDPERTLAVWQSGLLAHRIMLCLLLAGGFLWLAASIWNTRSGIHLLESKNLFLFNESWGNGRGAAVKAGFRLFGKMPVINRLLGVGPDCFSWYAYSLPEIAADIRSSFGNNRLTNAHNELLTSLINTGVIGTFLYLGIFVSFITRMMKKGEEKVFIYTAAVCVFCYLCHNMVSFAQVLNLPFVFLIMAMGEKVHRVDKFSYFSYNQITGVQVRQPRF